MNMDENTIEINLGDFYNESQHNLSQHELYLAAKKMGRINVDPKKNQRIIISGFPTEVAMWLNEKY